MEKKIVIAVDGFAACGKSTIAKDLARELGYAYIDSGAMYRAVTLYFLRKKIDLDNPGAVKQALAEINIHFENINGSNHTFLNGENVEEEIREMAVSNFVSEVAAISAVRRVTVQQQHEMGKKRGVVMDGRDIGTVVFKDAELKLFITADMAIRTKRRLLELMDRGVTIDPEKVTANLKHRDHIDSTREDSPLKKAEDAIVIDNSYLSRSEQLEIALKLAKQRLEFSNSEGR
ncbi:MAG: (d)CMP kinase [Bacteroidota bacterium]